MQRSGTEAIKFQTQTLKAKTGNNKNYKKSKYIKKTDHNKTTTLKWSVKYYWGLKLVVLNLALRF